VATFVLFFVFRKNKQPIFVTEKTVVTDYFPTALLIGTVRPTDPRLVPAGQAGGDQRHHLHFVVCDRPDPAVCHLPGF
jgi:hypothetical protein